jgi:glycosyltransferase involved in cell wall biosynthesis
MALRRQGCEVIEAPHSLRYLRFRYCYGALLYLNALLAYGVRYREQLNRTWAAQWVRGKANQMAVSRHENLDAVISLQQMPTYTRRRQGIVYAIFTDHVNLLSKRGPDFGIDFPERRVSTAWNRYERRALQSQDRVFTLSKYVQRSLVEDYGVRPDNVVVVGAGPNLDVDCVRDGIVKRFDARNVLFVGLDPVRKGLPQLLRAFARVAEIYPNARLNVVGVDGSNTSHVTYHGPLYGDPLKKLFYESQVFVMPTLREPFGIVFLEAMWAKAVCIGTRIGAIPELVEDGVTGFLVEPNDADALAERMIEMFSDTERMRAMAEAAYRAARDKWCWDMSANHILRSLFPRERFDATTSEPLCRSSTEPNLPSKRLSLPGQDRFERPPALLGRQQQFDSSGSPMKNSLACGALSGSTFGLRGSSSRPWVETKK